MGSKKNSYEESWQWYQDFLKAWYDGSLSKSDKVYELVTAMSWKMCWNYSCLDDANDLSQEVMKALAKGQYNKGASLKTYIRTIMTNQIRKWWKKDGQGKKDVFDDAALRKIDKKFSVAAEIERRMCVDDDLKEVLSKLPNPQSTILKVILKYENENNKLPSVRKIKEKINEGDPEHKVTRHFVGIELKRLENNLGIEIRELS